MVSLIVSTPSPGGLGTKPINRVPDQRDLSGAHFPHGAAASGWSLS